jgi:drug/metabolite transporter (DMT)-like permease
MTFLTVSLVVLAAFIHAGWNLLSKRAAIAGPVFVLAQTAVICIVYAPWLAWVLVHDGMTWSWPIVGCILLSAIATLAYTLSLQHGYRVADLSVVYPVARGTGPLLAALGAFLFFGEEPTAARIAGIAAVVVGILLVSTRGKFGAFRQAEGLRGLLWGAATGFLVASYTVVDAYGVEVLAIAPVVLIWFSSAFRTLLLAPHVIANRAQVRARMAGKWWFAVGVGVLAPLGYILILTSLKLGAPLSVVAPMREMSMMLAALLGMTILRERVGPWGLAGCVIMIAGVVLLGLS